MWKNNNKRDNFIKDLCDYSEQNTLNKQGIFVLWYNILMQLNLDGSISLEKGEIMPFICPKCKWAIEYDKKLLMVNCFHCTYVGDREEFTQEFSGIKV